MDSSSKKCHQNSAFKICATGKGLKLRKPLQYSRKWWWVWHEVGQLCHQTNNLRGSRAWCFEHRVRGSHHLQNLLERGATEKEHAGQKFKANVSDLERWMQKYQPESVLRRNKFESNQLSVLSFPVAKSSRKLNLQEMVGTHEFANYNSRPMRPDGSLITATNKWTPIHELKGVALGTWTPEDSIEEPNSPRQSVHVFTGIVIDGMTVLQETVTLSVVETYHNVSFKETTVTYTC